MNCRPRDLTLREAFEWEVPYEETQECIRWYGPVAGDCCMFYYHGLRISACRMAYQLYCNDGEPLPDDMHICHTEQCHLGRFCVNWRHLALMPRAPIPRDERPGLLLTLVRCGSSWRSVPRQRRRPRSLTVEEVQAIHRDTRPSRAVARDHGVHWRTVYLIRKRAYPKYATALSEE